MQVHQIKMESLVNSSVKTALLHFLKVSTVDFKINNISFATFTKNFLPLN